MFELLSKGGPVMYVLLAVSVYVTAVVIYKAYQFWQCSLSDCEFAKDIINSLKRSDVENANVILNTQVNPLARVVETAIHCITNADLSKESKENEINLAGNAELQKLESHLKGLEMAANISPLLGLLGTVTGMVQAFSVLEQAGSRIDPSLLAGGIWEALLTTVAGLAVAIPAMVAHHIIDGKIERFRNNMEEATTRIINLDTRTLKPASVLSHAF